MARTPLCIIAISIVSLFVTASAGRADEKALKKQFDALNELTGSEPADGALRSIIKDKKDLPQLLAYGLPFAKKKQMSYNGALVLAFAAADEKDMTTAEIYFRVCMDQALKLQSASKVKQSYFMLAANYFDNKQYGNAVRVCREVLELNTNDGKTRFVVQTKEDPRTKEVEFEEPTDGFTTIDQVREDIFDLLIKSTSMLGKHDQAIKLVDGLLKRQDDVYNRRLKGWVLREAGKLDESAGVYEDLITKVSSLPGVDEKVRDDFVGQLRYEVSNVYVDLKKIDRASAHLEYLLKKNPSNATYYNDLGYIWADNNMKLDKAEEYIRKAIDLDRADRKKKKDYNPKTDHDSGAYLDSLGWVLFKLKKNEEAKEWLLKATAEKDGKHIEIYDHLGDVYAALGERGEAIRAYENGLKHVTEARRDQERKATVEKKLEKLKSTK